MLKLTHYINGIIDGVEFVDVQHKMFNNEDELCTCLGKELTPQIKKKILKNEFPVIFLVRDDGYPLPMCIISYRIDLEDINSCEL